MIAGQDFDHIKEHFTAFIEKFKFTSPLPSVHTVNTKSSNTSVDIPESVTIPRDEKSTKPGLSSEQRDRYLVALNDITDCLAQDEDIEGYSAIANAAKTLKEQIKGKATDDTASIDSSLGSVTTGSSFTGSTRSSRSRRTNKTSKTSGSSSSYGSSVLTYGRDKTKVKTRAKFSEKLIWDGRRTAFKALSNLIMGHLHQVNASYMVNPSFLQKYSSKGSRYLKSSRFKRRFGISYEQALYDRKYLFGILQTVTRAGGSGYKHVLK